MTFNFQVGDIVRFHTQQYEDEIYEEADRQGIDLDDVDFSHAVRAHIVKTGHRIGGRDWLNYLVQFDDGTQLFVRSKWITLCTTCNNAARTNINPSYRADANAAAEKETSMSVLGTAVNKVRELAMSKDERLLKKYNVVDECGNVTHDGKELLLELLFNENKDTVVAKLAEIDKEEKEASKKSK